MVFDCDTAPENDLEEDFDCDTVSDKAIATNLNLLTPTNHKMLEKEGKKAIIEEDEDSYHGGEPGWREGAKAYEEKNKDALRRGHLVWNPLGKY